MTQTFWTLYLRLCMVGLLVASVEYLTFRTLWSFTIVFGAIAILVFSLKCRSCGLRAYDHRIATHFRGHETLKDCPNCHQPMVEQA